MVYRTIHAPDENSGLAHVYFFTNFLEIGKHWKLEQ